MSKRSPGTTSTAPLARRVISAALLTGLAACADPAADPLEASLDTSIYALVETIDGTSFFPPLGPAVTPTGTFDASLLSQLTVALDATDGAGNTTTVTTFDATTSPALLLKDYHEAYYVNVPAFQWITDRALAYSFRVMLGDREIGRSDLSPVVFEVMARVPRLYVGVKVRIESRAAPVLSTLTPASVLVGASDVTVTLGGARFATDSIARIDGLALETTWVSADELRAVVPAAMLAAAADHAIDVVTPAPGGGTSGSLAFVAARPAPIVSSIAPATARPGDPGFTLTITGSGFVAESVASFGGVGVTTTWVSSTVLEAAVPASMIATIGSYPVSVSTPAPGGGTSGAQLFSVEGARLTDGLVAQYDFEETSGAALDRSGNGNNLTFNAATRLAAGYGAAPNSRGISCAAAGQTLTAVSSASLRSPRNQLTVALWIKPTVTTGNPGILSHAVRAGSSQNWGFYIRNGNELGIFTNYPSRSSSVYDSTSVGANIVAGEWAHVAFVLDYVARTTTYYKNGRVISSHPHTLPLDQLANPLTLCSEAGAVQDYSGQIDDLSIWSRALSADELATVARGLTQAHAGVLGSGTTCRSILDAGASRGSGLYALDPDGLGGAAPFVTSCDMVGDGGGWTLVANQAPTSLINQLTTADVSPQNDGSLTSTFRFGNTRVQAFSPTVGWRIRSLNASGAVVDNGFFRPTCVINWTRMVGTRTADCTNHAEIQLVSALDTACGILYTTPSFTTQVSGYTTANCSLGIGQNNSGGYCSMRMGSVGWGTVPVGAAIPCSSAQTTALTMQLWVK
ncbi:IPT/TIG domain-containing protein [Myxococcota bacterium]|nr:IPT/TIG domain-containing protein [Myxococcota bacterium]